MRHPTAVHDARLTLLALSTALLWASPAVAAGDDKGLVQASLKPIHDTWATHDDGLVHGAEATLKVGIERQACDPNDAKNACTTLKPALACCPAKGTTPAFCAPAGTCDSTPPTWTSFRKFRTYLRFDLASLPKGKVVKAELSMRVGEIHEVLGPPAKVVTTRLKQIGLTNPICTWDEKKLSDTNGTTWSSLPQNVASAPGQVWIFDVTKAVADWTTGDTDKAGNPVQSNCGFHVHDPDFGNKNAPIERFVTFDSKEGKVPPVLNVTIAIDNDKDGYTADVDCNDSDPKVHPGAIDVCGDNLDNDCSGKVDDEVCDGHDNDCDGTVDEGELAGSVAPCPEGLVCANHTCVTACKDDCGGPTDRKCDWDDQDKVWVVWGCAKADADPCWDWKKYEPCNKGQSCEYGSCSNNCVDLCDKVGEKSCAIDKLGMWHVTECGNWDVDPCLEPKDVQDCGVGASCKDATCGIDGCADTCKTLGQVTCDGGKAVVCMDQDGNGCLDQKLVVDCAPNACQEPLGCALPGASQPGPDAGSTADAASAPDTAGGADTASGPDAADAGVVAADTALVGGDVEGGADAGTAADIGGGAVDGGTSDAKVSDVAPLDAGVDATSGCGSCPPGQVCNSQGQCEAKPTGGDTGKKDDGCTAGRQGGSPWAFAGIVALLCLGLALRRRTSLPQA